MQKEKDNLLNLEILSPAGNMEKLKTAIYYGADAVYFAGKSYGLRAFSDNFTEEEIIEAVEFCHTNGVKAYVTVNIIAHNVDFEGLLDYAKFLEKAKVDALIVSDVGIIKFLRDNVPNVDIHVSTQANITNIYSAKFFADLGVKRIVLARELSLTEIRQIKEAVKDVELEAFVHGAMCISYSGRCLLSNYMANRDSNKGACVQACRWQYCITEKSKTEPYEIQEDKRGTYILNSKDLNMLEYLDKLIDAGVTSFKIEGRMKSPYYVATVTNAYRRALDLYLKNSKKYKLPKELIEELLKTSHRQYTTGFNLKDIKEEESEYLKDSMPVQTHEFMAIVTEVKDKVVEIEQRNRFKTGDVLEILSPSKIFNEKLKVPVMFDEKNNQVNDAKNVQQKLYFKSKTKFNVGDILRKKN